MCPLEHINDNGLQIMDATILETQLRNLIDLNPSTLTVGTATYTVTKTALKSGKKITEYGRESSYDFSLIAVKTDFTTVPEVKSRVTYNSMDYRIMGKEEDSFGIGIRLDCGAV